MDEPGLPPDGSPEAPIVISEKSDSIRSAPEIKAAVSEEIKDTQNAGKINDEKNNAVSVQETSSEAKPELYDQDMGNNIEKSLSPGESAVETGEANDEQILENSDSEHFVESEADKISLGLEGLSRKLDNLQEEFGRKLKYDAHKEKLIDSLHKELQLYKEDLVKKHVQSMIMDVIKIIDDIRKLSEHYHTCPLEEIEVEKLLGIFDRIPSDLEDIFFYQGIIPYECNGDIFDPKRQRILKNIDTLDQSKDKMIAESIRPGYEWEGRVLRPEIVAVYHYKEPNI
jgi:molecular chaperone GrpE (heat shock protein)